MKFLTLVFTGAPYNTTNTPPPIGTGVFSSSDSPVGFFDVRYVPYPLDNQELSVCNPSTTHGKCADDCLTCAERFKSNCVTTDYLLFKKAYEIWVNEPSPKPGVILVKDTTVSAAATGATIASAITAAELASGNKLDMFYIAKWLDRADQFTVIGSLPGGGSIVRTWNPHGVQALAFTARGFEKVSTCYNPTTNPVVCRSFSQVLNVLVQKGTVYAATTTPSLLQFDSLAALSCDRSRTSKGATKFSYLKTCETRGEIDPEKPLTRRISCDLTLFWAVIIIITVAFSTWILLKFGAFYIMGSESGGVQPVNTVYSIGGNPAFQKRYEVHKKKMGSIVSI